MWRWSLVFHFNWFLNPAGSTALQNESLNTRKVSNNLKVKLMSSEKKIIFPSISTTWTHLVLFYLNFDEMLEQSGCKVLTLQTSGGVLVCSALPGVHGRPGLLPRHDDQTGAVRDQLEVLLLVHLRPVLLQHGVHLLVIRVAQALLSCRRRISVWWGLYLTEPRPSQRNSRELFLLISRKQGKF